MKTEMGQDVPTTKVVDWFKNYKISYKDTGAILRKIENGEEFYSFILKPDLDWEFGKIEIFFRFKFKQKSYSTSKQVGFTRGFEPKVAMGYDRPTNMVRNWFEKYKILSIDPGNIRRGKNDKGEQFYFLTLIPNLDLWEYGDIEMIFHVDREC